mgnify:CR=1 FL=1
MKKEMEKRRIKEERKTYKEGNNDNYNMPPGNSKGLPDESSKDHKTYKDYKVITNSNLRIVTIFPGNRKVAGCFYFLEDLFDD